MKNEREIKRSLLSMIGGEFKLKTFEDNLRYALQSKPNGSEVVFKMVKKEVVQSMVSQGVAAVTARFCSQQNISRWGFPAEYTDFLKKGYGAIIRRETDHIKYKTQ